MRSRTLMVCVAFGSVLSLASWSRVVAQEQGKVADGVLPGGNILSCETYSLRDLFREQKPDPQRPWVGKYPQLTIDTFPAFMKELGIKGVAIKDGYIGSLEESNLDKIEAACKASDRVITAPITGGPLALADEAKRLEGLKAVEKDPVEGVKKSRDLIITPWKSGKPVVSFDPVKQFEHIGIFTAEKKPNARCVAATKVWVTDFQKHPYGVEWLRSDGPFRGPNPHLAFRVANIETAAAAAQGLKSTSKPFDAGIARVAFYQTDDGAVVEFMEYYKEYAKAPAAHLPFDHIGLITTEKKPNETFVAATKVWVTDIAAHPYRVEWLRYEPDSPVKGPVREQPHVAFRVASIAEAAKGLKVLIAPFDAGIAKVGFYQADDGAVVEFMEYYKK